MNPLGADNQGGMMARSKRKAEQQAPVRPEGTSMGSGTFAKHKALGSAGNEAHADMLRAVERGLCTILTDELASDGTEQQWTAKLKRDGTLTVSRWRHREEAGWSQGVSFDIDVNGVAGLAQLLDRHGL